MREKLFPALMIAVLAAALTTACTRQETTVTDTATETAVTTTETGWTDTRTETGTATGTGITGMGDTGPGSEWVSSVRLGRELNQEGGVPVGSATSTFRIGEPIHVAMQIDRRPPDGRVRVVWYGQNNQQIGEDSREVQPNTVINFRAPAEMRQAGEYRVDVMANNALVKTERFTIQQ